MQPIDPPVGGGRVRLLGLYHAMGDGLQTTYVGTYDWPGPGYRDHYLSSSLREIDVPLSRRHFQVQQRWNDLAGFPTLIDVMFPLLMRLSPDFLRTARQAVSDADIVVFSHPWIFSGVREALDFKRQLIVYDSQNVEGLLRTELLDRDPLGIEIAKFVTATECELVSGADIVLACSNEDASLFHDLYGIKREKVRVVPNGAFTDAIRPANSGERLQARRKLRLREPTVLFMGSGYGPNLQAARFINQTLAPALPEVTFVICGGVGDLMKTEAHAPNVQLLGTVDEAKKNLCLRAAQAAINPMFAGSGTNIKMLDFMAAGLPIVSTPVGARGLEGAGDAFLLADSKDFAQILRHVLAEKSLAAELGRRARKRAESTYSWERISSDLGSGLSHRLAEKRERNAKGPRDVPASRPAPASPAFPPSASLSLLIGTYFLPNQQGWERLLGAVVLLKDLWGDMEVLAVTPTPLGAPDDSFDAYGKKYVPLDVEDLVLIKAGQGDDLISDLSACHLIVLPFSDSTDAGRRVLETSLATGRPVIAPRAASFQDPHARIYRVESLDPPALAIAIANVASTLRSSSQ